jgi:hypothetical protein
MENCAVKTEKLWIKTVRCQTLPRNDELKFLSAVRSPKQNVWRACFAVIAGATPCRIIAHARGRRPALRDAPPRELPKPRFNWLFGPFLADRAGCTGTNFGNPANELQYAIEACRSAAGFCYERALGFSFLLSWSSA